MDYMEKMGEAVLKIVKFFEEGRYTDKNGVLWLGIEGDSQEEDRWFRQDTKDSISSAEMQKKMGYELMGWDEEPAAPEPNYFYSTDTPHKWSSGASFHDYDPDAGGKITSLARAKELAEKAQVGKWGEERYVKTTYGVSYDTEVK